MIYLDHHAATPLDDAARSAMERARSVAWANPASPHAAGRAARAIVEDARRRLALALAVVPSQIVFTAGGSEACQAGIEGVVPRPSRIVTTTIEHPAVARTIDRLEAGGIETIRLPVAPTGITVDTFVPLLGPDALVAVQWVNHETGVFLPVEGIARACRVAGAKLFVDATQAFGKLPIDLGALGATTVALGSTKIGGPAGAGALVVGTGESVEPILLGGGQERGLRAGTPSVEAIAGFGAAASAIDARLVARPGIAALRDRLEAGLRARGAIVNGGDADRVATCSSVSFPGRRATVLAAGLDLEGVAVATGPACSSGLDTPSPTVLAMHADDPARASSTLRFSLGPTTRQDEVDAALAAVERVLSRVAAR